MRTEDDYRMVWAAAYARAFAALAHRGSFPFSTAAAAAEAAREADEAVAALRAHDAERGGLA